MLRSLVLAALLFALPARAVVPIEWVTVEGAGNACDTQPQGCFGSVARTYRISKFEVSNGQYVAFLNAVAATDTNALYNTSMGSGFGGIARSGSSGSFSYSAIAGREDKPVNLVSFYDALRFANWLQNGQPTGAQDNTTTEDGAYTMISETYPGTVITRNAGAAFFLTSEDEWYKAAYYDTASMSYFDYPAGSDTQITCAVPGATANTANCNDAVADLTDVGSYTGAASPNGTFDQGGNVWELNEAIIGDIFRGSRGGNFVVIPNILEASFQVVGAPEPADEFDSQGFRVASLPASVPSLTPVSLLVMASLLGLAGYRRSRG